MTIRPQDQYPGQVDTSDPAMPYGKFKNVAVQGDGSGSPLEKNWPNDILGAFFAVLDSAGITPNNVPDKVGASQFLDALIQVVSNLVPIRWVGSVSCQPTTPIATTSWGPAPDSVSYSGLGLAVGWTTPPWEQESSNLMVSLVASAAGSRDRHATGGLNAGDDIFCHVWDTTSGAEVDLDNSFETINFVILGTKI